MYIHIDMVGVIEKDVLAALAKTASEWARNMNEQISLAKYDLVANICHDSSGAQELTVKAGHSTGQSNAAAKAAATAKVIPYIYIYIYIYIFLHIYIYMYIYVYKHSI
jgi:uncharacterized protein YcbK (DUF882 family)